MSKTTDRATPSISKSIVLNQRFDRQKHQARRTETVAALADGSHVTRHSACFRKTEAKYDRIYRLDVLMTAWQIVVQNDGAPGVDGQSCRDIIGDGTGGLALVQELHEELRTKRYQPQPVKRV